MVIIKLKIIWSLRRGDVIDKNIIIQIRIGVCLIVKVWYVKNAECINVRWRDKKIKRKKIVM